MACPEGDERYLGTRAGLMFTKFIFIFDEDVNVQNTSEAAWKAFNNVDPSRDLLISEGPLDVLDHSSPRPIYGRRWGLTQRRNGLKKDINGVA